MRTRGGSRGRVTIARHADDPRSAFSQARKEGPRRERERKIARHKKAQQAVRQKQAIARQTIISKLRAKGFSDAQIAAHLGETDD